MKGSLRASMLTTAFVFSAALARADEPEEITVFGHKPVTAASQIERGREDFELRPVQSPAQILEVVPGLVTAQHAGGGKSDQILIRGFDADHGTDMALFVGGIPVNLRSHAHGQGYADLHFLIPELVERMQVQKGTYSAEVGDFVTAGAVDLVLKEELDESFASLQVGTYDTQRVVLGLSPVERSLAAIELYRTDGPFDQDEKLTRTNLFGSYVFEPGPRDSLRVWGSYYGSEWNASGQIPWRLVENGTIDRFGDLDQKEGGKSWRWNLMVDWDHDFASGASFEARSWLSTYSLDLYSNFTGFTLDPVQGDGFAQRDQRVLYGSALRYRTPFLPDDAGTLTLGADFRMDDAHVALQPQKERQLSGPATADDRIREYSVAPLIQAEWQPLPWVRSLLGFRAERFGFNVKNRGGVEGPSGHDADWMALPKSSLVLAPFSADAPWPQAFLPLRSTELFLNYGRGFHSNDARDVVADPRGNTLPAASGYEIGVRTRLAENVDLAVSYWWLNLENEIVFVGDEGVTEPSQRSKRRGVEAVGHVGLTDWLDLNVELAYSVARFVNGDPIAQAPRMVFGSSLVAHHPSGFSGQVLVRSLGERYGLEDDRSVRLHGYTVVDLGASWRRGPFELRAVLANVFDTDWESAEFYYESQYPGAGETAPIGDFHFTPGIPRSVYVTATWSF